MKPKNHLGGRNTANSQNDARSSRQKAFLPEKDLEWILTKLIKPLLHAAGLEYGALLKVKEARGVFSLYGLSIKKDEPAALFDFSLEDKTGPLARSIMSRSPIFLPYAAPLTSHYGDSLPHFFAQGSVALIPIVSEDRVYAVFVAGRVLPSDVSIHEQTLLTAVSEIISFHVSNLLLKEGLSAPKEHASSTEMLHPDMDKLAAIGNLVAEAAKNLNKPLSCIAAYIDTLKSNISPTSDVYDTLERISRESERARRIASSLSALSAWCGRPKDTGPPPYHPATGKPIKILIVDDELAIQESMREVLKRKKFVVDTVGTAADAFLLIPKEGYDIVICDARLPDMSTEELLKNINKAEGLLRRTILMSGDTANETINNFFQNNPVHYLTKPFHPADLLAMIDKIISGEQDAQSNTAVA